MVSGIVTTAFIRSLHSLLPASTPPAGAPEHASEEAPPEQAPASGVSSFFPAPRRPNHDVIFGWVETQTETPIAYRSDEAKQAYIESLKGKPQSHYDTKGFLASLGIFEAETYGREPKTLVPMLDHIGEYRPSGLVGLVLGSVQKRALWLWRNYPDVFLELSAKIDPFLCRDEIQLSWSETVIPQPQMEDTPAVSLERIYKNYSGTRVVREARKRPRGQKWGPMAPLGPVEARKTPPGEHVFTRDFHLGEQPPGTSSPQYGTMAIALGMGFDLKQAARLGVANHSVDTNKTPYGETSSIPGNAVSRHFNINYRYPELGDTRFIWAKRHLEAAVALARQGKFGQAELELGYGLHSLQDAFAHGHLTPFAHVVLGEIPDRVDYNPVAMWEATQATTAYLNTYLRRIIAPARR